MKTITKLFALLVVALSLFTTACSEEFVVEKSQLVGIWEFPENLAPDTISGLNWASARMNIRNEDTITVNTEAGKVFLWTLRDNNVTATATPRPNVPESWVIAFTVEDVNSKELKINGKYRHIYNDDNTPLGDISCTLKKYVPAGN